MPSKQIEEGPADVESAYAHLKNAYQTLKGARRKNRSPAEVKIKKVRRRSDKPPTDKQKASRELFKKRIAWAKEHRNEGETWKAAFSRASQELKA